jgi:NitT/TauT family transport system permease protein
VVGAYALSLAVALPLAIVLARHPKASRLGLPAVEVVASIPATAFFPVFVFVLLGVVGLEGAAVLLLVTGMIWYLFFNVLSGLRAIPPDLGEAAQAFGLRRGRYYRRLVFPAILPAFITGSITAFGGGWNTLVLAEYFPANPPHPSLVVVGVGAFLDESFALGQWALFVATLLTLVLTVVVLNELIWKPLYRRVVGRYRYD